MTKAIATPRYTLIFGVPFLMIIGLVLLTQSAIYNQYPQEISIGILADLFLTIPLVYFLLIRKTSVPKRTILFLIIVGIAVVNFFIPLEYQFFFAEAKYWLIPVIELTVFATIFWKVRQTLKTYKAQKEENVDFFITIQKVTQSIMPAKVAPLVAMEIAVFYYGFFHWKKRILAVNEFSYHRKNGVIAILYAFLLAIVVETVAIHFLLEKWSVVAAWILSILSIYTLLQVFALIKSIPRRPIKIGKNHLYLQFGFFGEATIPLSAITSVELDRKSLDKRKDVTLFSPLGGIEGHNIILHLNREHTLTGIYGMKKQFTKLAIFIDEKDRFVEMLNQS